MKRIFAAGAAGLFLALAAGEAAAEGTYVAFSANWIDLKDSANSGATTSDFTVADGRDIDSGTSLGWDTVFDSGFGGLAAIGHQFGRTWRLEAELGYRSNDIDRHEGVTLGGADIGGESARLLAGAAAPDITVDTLMADGRGDMESWSLMANLYRDIPIGDTAFAPYLGVGAGVARMHAAYRPSGQEFFSGSTSKFAWQVMAGLGYALSNRAQIFAGYRYFRASNARFDVETLPASLKVKYRFNTIEGGLRLLL